MKAARKPRRSPLPRLRSRERIETHRPPPPRRVPQPSRGSGLGSGLKLTPRRPQQPPGPLPRLRSRERIETRSAFFCRPPSPPLPRLRSRERIETLRCRGRAVHASPPSRGSGLGSGLKPRRGRLMGCPFTPLPRLRSRERIETTSRTNGSRPSTTLPRLRSRERIETSASRTRRSGRPLPRLRSRERIETSRSGPSPWDASPPEAPVSGAD